MIDQVPEGMSLPQLNPDYDNYGVMGNPVSHSLSPRIHTEFARQTGQQLIYQAFPVDRGSFACAVDNFREQGGKGLNVTVPFKEEAYQYARSLSSLAEKAGAVNTLIFSDREATCHGENTDGIGLIRDLKHNHSVIIAGKAILILGAGGAVRGILETLLDEAPARIVIANRTVSRAEELVRVFSRDSEVTASGYESLGTHAFDIVINATSMGLHGEIPPLPAEALEAAPFCYDMVYGQGSTPFVAWARSNGAGMAVDGLGMLVEQAAESFYLWRGVRPETLPVITLLRETTTS